MNICCIWYTDFKTCFKKIFKPHFTILYLFRLSVLGIKTTILNNLWSNVADNICGHTGFFVELMSRPFQIYLIFIVLYLNEC